MAKSSKKGNRSKLSPCPDGEYSSKQTGLCEDIPCIDSDGNENPTMERNPKTKKCQTKKCKKGTIIDPDTGKCISIKTKKGGNLKKISKKKKKEMLSKTNQKKVKKQRRKEAEKLDRDVYNSSDDSYDSSDETSDDEISENESTLFECESEEDWFTGNRIVTCEEKKSRKNLGGRPKGSRDDPRIVRSANVTNASLSVKLDYIIELLHINGMTAPCAPVPAPCAPAPCAPVASAPVASAPPPPVPVAPVASAPIASAPVPTVTPNVKPSGFTINNQNGSVPKTPGGVIFGSKPLN